MIRIIGDSEAAKGARMILGQAGFPLGDYQPTFTVYVDESATPCPIIDSVDCLLERRILVNIAELSPSGRVVIQRQGGIQSDAEIRITCPALDPERFAVKTGILRALLQLTNLSQPSGAVQAPPRKRWFER